MALTNIMDEQLSTLELISPYRQAMDGVKPERKVEYIRWLLNSIVTDIEETKKYAQEHGVTFEQAMEKLDKDPLTEEQRRYFMKD